MRSNPHHPAQEVTSLEDSTYEVLDHPGDLSDDDGRTASVASTSPDDMSVSLSETESEDEDDFGDDGEGSQLADSTIVDSDPLDAQVTAAGEDSTLTERPGLGDSESGFHFKMDEYPLEGYPANEGVSVVKEFTPEQSTSKVLEPYGCSEIRLTVRAGLADRSYPDRGTFRVLFVGKLDAWSEEGIKTSLLNALVASPGSSKSVMVHGQMEAYSPVLHTDHCTEVGTEADTNNRGRIILKLDGSEGAEITLDSLGRVQKNANSAPVPDLAIFCHPKSSATSLAESDLLQVRRAFRWNNIPFLDITDHRRFNEKQPGFNFAVDPRRLRVCVEGVSDTRSHIVDELPVDVYTFMHLEPSDLNRHLAAINPHPRVGRPSGRDHDANFRAPAGLIPSFVQDAFRSLTGGDILHMLIYSMLLLIVVVAGSYVGAGSSQLTQDMRSPGVVQPFIASSAVSTPVSAEASLTSQAIIPTSTNSSVKDLIDDFWAKQRQTAQTETEKTAEKLRKTTEKNAENSKISEKLREKLEKKKAEMRRREEVAKATKIGGFEIQTNGGQQFILRPSRGFIGRTRKPQLQIQVSRDSKTVPIRYERTMDGVYIVDLEKEYPVGFFNVSIVTHSKPLMQQSFNIKLGNSRSRVEQWVSMVQREGASVQHTLYDVSTNLLQRLQTVSARLADGAQEWKGTVKHSSQELMGRLQDGRKVVDRQLTEVRDQTWMSLRQTTAPVRTSRRTLWARNNAYVLRCGFERAVGLSSKDKDGKRTRSCKAANW